MINLSMNGGKVINHFKTVYLQIYEPNSEDNAPEL